MSKIRGFILVDFGDWDVEPAYVDNPKREYIEPGDEVLVQMPDGDVCVTRAVSDIQSHYDDRSTDRILSAVLGIFGKQTVEELPKLIGTVQREYWYGNPEVADEA